ncbi:hypothetical protein PO124_11800 [Bacillus licheniformis]|nr:hypothetical protein [Bacillus licheniformis]
MEKMQEEYPDDARMEPWKERKERDLSSDRSRSALPHIISAEERGKAQLKAVLDSQMAKRRLKISLSDLCFTGKAVQPLIQRRATCLQDCKAIEQADQSAMEQEAMCFGFPCHSADQGLRASAENAGGLAAAIYYIWKTEHQERLTKPKPLNFQISPGTLSKYERTLKSIYRNRCELHCSACFIM